MPIDTLKGLRFSLYSLAEIFPRGSCERQNVLSITKGIKADLDWCIANLEAAGEGKKNFGLVAYPDAAQGKGGSGG